MNPSRILPLLLAVTACAPSPSPFTDADRESAQAEVRAVSEALVAALNAHDADAILAFYALDDDFTQVACTDMLFGGRGFEALTRSLHANYEDAVYRMDVRGVRVVGPDVAVVSLQGTMLAPLFVTRILRREGDGRWLVVWEHESWPGCAAPSAPHPGTAAGDTLAMGTNPDGGDR